jgi:hypothetical protein
VILLVVAVLATVEAPPARAEVPQAVDAGENVVLTWNAAALQAIRDVAPAPPVAARSLAIVHTAMYDAWTAYTPLAVSTAGDPQVRRPSREGTDANKREAVSYAAFAALRDQFPTREGDVEAILTRLGYDPGDRHVDDVTPVGIGNAAAAAVLAVRHRDGSNQLGDLTPSGKPYADYTGYVPVNSPERVKDPDRWQPLRLPNDTVQTFSVPQWGRVLPFALRRGSQFRPPAPPAFGSAANRAEIEELLAFSAGLNDERKAIAEYWSDGPRSEQPPGHWNLFAQWVSNRDHHTLDADVGMFFALNNALLDASIAAWDAKRAYDCQRPIAGVRTLLAGQTVRAWAGPYQGTRDIAADAWLPYFRPDVITPPFPEYVSGHSTFSAAAATVLAAFTGGDGFGASAVVPRGWSLVEPGATPSVDVTLTWPTFSAAADQAGISRRYGGIHYRSGDLAGRLLGREVGALATGRAFGYLLGIR